MKESSGSQNYSSGSNSSHNSTNYGSYRNLSQNYSQQTTASNEVHDSDELLSTLNNFIKANEKKLRSGTTHLTLNPICLEFLNLYLKGKRVSFKVSKSEILDLQFILTLIKHLKIDPNQPELLEKSRVLDLSIFESIKELEMYYVKPGLIKNLFELSQKIERLTVNCSLNSLDELLIVEDENALPFYDQVSKMIFINSDDGQPLRGQDLVNKRFQHLYKKNNIWSHLKELDLSFNSIPKIDMTAYSLCSVEKLCFEGNLISTIDNLQECLYLRVLNLSFNRIKTLDNINEVLGMITHLSLRGNQIEYTDSLNRLYALECLDISKNQIKHIEEIFKLNQLPNLKYLFTDENPFCDLKDYRNLIIFNFLNNSFNYFDTINLQSFYLDGKRIQQYEIDFINKHTIEHGTFKTYQSPIKVSKQSSKDIIPRVELAPNAKIDQIVSQSPQSSILNSYSNGNNRVINNNNRKPKSNKHKHHHPHFNHTKTIEPVIDSLPEDFDGELEEKKNQDDLKFEEENSLKKKIENLRSEGGNSWLLVLNEESTFKENINNYDHSFNHSNSNLVSTPNKKLTPQKQLKSPLIKKKKSPSKSSSTPSKVNKKLNFSNDTIEPTNLDKQFNNVSINDNNSSNLSSSPSSTSSVSNNNNNNNNNSSISNSNSNSNNTSLSTSPLNKTTDIPNVTTTTTTTTTIDSNNNNKSNRSSLSTSPLNYNSNNTILSKSPSSLSKSPSLPNINSENSLKNILSNNNNNINNQELICEPFSIEKNNQKLLLQIKTDTMLETNIYGNTVNSYLLKDIVFVFDVQEAQEPNTVEIVFAANYKDGVPNVFTREYYQMEDRDSVKQITTILQPPLFREYTMSCMQCSERYVCKMENDFFQCVKCQSKLLFYIPTSQDSSLLVVESPSASFSNSLSLKDMGKFIEYSDEGFNNYISQDQNIQLFFKLKIFKGDSKEVFLFMMKSNYIRYNQPQEEEKTIYLLLSSTTLYLLNKKEKKSEDSYSVYIQMPLKDIKRVTVALSSQSFRVEMDEHQNFIFLKRSQEATDTFLHHLFEAAKQLKLPLENVNRSVETRQAIKSILIDENEEFQRYIMLHHKISGRNIQPKSFIITNERLYLVNENYSQFPLLNNNKPIKPTLPQFQIYKSYKITDIVSIKYSKQKLNHFGVVFEIENSNGGNHIIEWNLITSNSIECETVVGLIKKQWKEKFGLDLKVDESF